MIGVVNRITNEKREKKKKIRDSARTECFTGARSFLRPSVCNRVFSQRQNIPKYPSVSVGRRAEQEEVSYKPCTPPFANSSGWTCKSSDASLRRDHE